MEGKSLEIANLNAQHAEQLQANERDDFVPRAEVGSEDSPMTFMACVAIEEVVALVSDSGFVD